MQPSCFAGSDGVMITCQLASVLSVFMYGVVSMSAYPHLVTDMDVKSLQVRQGVQ